MRERQYDRLIIIITASTPSLQQHILPDCIKVLEDQSVMATDEQWIAMSGSPKPVTERTTTHPESVGIGWMDRWQKLSYSLKPHMRQTARAKLLAASLHRSTPVIGFMQPHSLDKTQTVRRSNQNRMAA